LYRTIEPEPEVDPTCSSDVGDLNTSYRSATSVYLYTPQPNGATQNQFRYRPVGSTAWALTDISNLYYKTAADVTPGVTYEFQMRNECSAGSWSAYTVSYNFSITGTINSFKQILPALSQFEVNNLAIENIMKIYPNPATNNIQITGFSQVENEVELTISDLIGNVILNKWYNVQSESINVKIDDLPTGIYLAELQQGDKHLIKKFIKE